MAKVDSKSPFFGCRGRIGDFVFRTCGGVTIVSAWPRKKNEPPTTKQESVENNFKTATLYAKLIVNVPALSSIYNQKLKKGQTIYKLAFKDFLTAPKVESIDCSGYSGAPGDIITVLAIDDFEVIKAEICIRNQEGKIIEEGVCKSEGKSLFWHYTTKSKIADVTGYTVKAFAMDNPGNIGELEVTIPNRPQ